MWFKKLLIVLLFLSSLSACKKDETTDVELHGIWSSAGVRYHFYPNQTYALEYTSLDSKSVADSLFGEYEVSKKRGNLYFTQKGYKDTLGVIRNKEAKLVWQYTIEDKELSYKNTTTEGLLRKVFTY